MTRSETAKFLDEMSSFYQGFAKNATDLTGMISLWQEAMEEHDYETMHKALIAFAQQDTRGYAPTVGQLLEIHRLEEEDPLCPPDHEYYPPDCEYVEEMLNGLQQSGS